MPVSDWSPAWETFDLHVRSGEPCDLRCGLVEGDRLAAHGVDDSGAPMQQAESEEPAHVLDVYVVACFLTAAEEGDRAILDRAAEKTIWTVAAVRIVRAVDSA